MCDVLERDVEQEPDVAIVERVVDVSALLAIADEAARAQEAQVVRAGRLRQPGRCGEIADTELSAFEKSDDQANAARIGEDAEGLGERLARAVVGQRRNDVGDALGVDALDLATVERDDVLATGSHSCMVLSLPHNIFMTVKIVTTSIRVDGMDCYDCAQTIERAVSRLPGVTATSVSFPAAAMRVEYVAGEVALDRIAVRVERLGYVVDGGRPRGRPAARWRLPRREALTALAAGLLGAAISIDLATAASALAIGLYVAAVVVVGLPVARAGIAALRATHRPDINLLMTIAVAGAMGIGAWLEAGLVVVLFSLGELLEGRAVSRARRELEGLVQLAPETARVRRACEDGCCDSLEEVEVPVAELAIGDLVIVRPGERIPADGTIVEGASAIDQAAITGESTPADRTAGEHVFAGTLNGHGLLTIEVGSSPGDMTLDRIGRLVAEAQARKSPSERWVDRFARIYTPTVMGAAVLVAAVPLAFGVSFSDAFYNALALLILACPCALVVSTPVSIVSALGRASAAGVLVKGGAYLEQAATIRTVAFDKTGTLTQGRPQVVEIEPLFGSESDVLQIAASLEQGSEHPLARAIVGAARGRDLALAPVEGFEALTGLGARGHVNGSRIEVGSPKLFDGRSLGGAPDAAAARLRARGQTAILVVRDGTPIGVMGLADQPRPEAAEAVSNLRALGIERTILLTGDNEATGRAIAADLGISDVRAELLPADKAAAVEELGDGVAMVGDGVNDAPALAAADLGLAMGSAGSDTAIEVADVALMGDDPRKVAGLIGLARWTKAVVRENIGFSLATKLIAVGVLAAGALPLWAAVASDVGASLVVVANGLRLIGGYPRGRLRSVPILGDSCKARSRERDRGSPGIAVGPGAVRGDDQEEEAEDDREREEDHLEADHHRGPELLILGSGDRERPGSGHVVIGGRAGDPDRDCRREEATSARIVTSQGVTAELTMARPRSRRS